MSSHFRSRRTPRLRVAGAFLTLRSPAAGALTGAPGRTLHIRSPAAGAFAGTLLLPLPAPSPAPWAARLGDFGPARESRILVERSFGPGYDLDITMSDTILHCLHILTIIIMPPLPCGPYQSCSYQSSPAAFLQ
jgi:hypothetical protein